MADDRPDRPRVFAIGLNKTGTTSLHDALTILGFRSLHWGGPPVRRSVERALEAGEPLLSGLDPRYDAFSDIEALSENYALLDTQYPGSTFILTSRPVEAWLESRRRHVLTNRERKARGDYDGDFLDIDELGWRAQYDAHYPAARRYFAGRDDFVEIDITAGDGWREICGLLDRPIPGELFPASNRGKPAGMG